MDAQDRTRNQLIETATDVFVEKGYHKASVREICRRAKANVAAVHYHFGDKAELYREVFRRPLSELAERSGDLTRHANVVDALAAFYRSMLEPLISIQRSCRLLRLHAREQFEPSGVLGDLRPQAFRASHELLTTLLCRELKLKKPDTETQRLAFALVGMTLPYWHACEMVHSYAPELLQGKDWVDRLSRRLATYSDAMIAAERRRRSSKKK